MKKAVLLFSMGGPKDLKDVRPFLFNLFSDPAIVRLPAPFRQIFAFWIAKKRETKAKKTYEKLGGFSPLLNQTLAQAQALERKLSEQGDYKCFVGMSYAAPFIRQAVKEAELWGAEKIFLLPLYPQYSTTTTESVLKEAHKNIRKENIKSEISEIRHFYDRNGFLTAMAENIKTVYEKAEKQGCPRLLLSAHGLPEHIIRAGDPYQKQCEKTAEEIVCRLDFEKLDHVLCYQSRVGPMKWIGPSTEEEIEKAGREGKAIIVAPIAFVSEHSETIVELGLEGRNAAIEAGAVFYEVVPTVQTQARFIEDLAALIINFNQNERNKGEK